MRLALTRLSILAPPLLGCTACAGGPPILTTQSAGCSSLIPHSWPKGIAGADLPEGQTDGDWIAFADAQTGKLDQANGRTRDAIGINIVERCEERGAAAIKKAMRRRVLGLF